MIDGAGLLLVGECFVLMAVWPFHCCIVLYCIVLYCINIMFTVMLLGGVWFLFGFFCLGKESYSLYLLFTVYCLSVLSLSWCVG